MMAPLFIPLALGLTHLYPWALADLVAADAGCGTKACTSCAVFRLRHFSISPHGSSYSAPAWAGANRREGARLSGPGLLLFGITASFRGDRLADVAEAELVFHGLSAADLVGQVLSALAFVIIRRRVDSRVAKAGRIPASISKSSARFVMTWAYLAFVQFLIQRSGICRGVVWFSAARKGAGLGRSLSACVPFGAPFLSAALIAALRPGRVFARDRAVLLFSQLAHVFWLVVPSAYPERSRPSLDFLMPIAVASMAGVFMPRPWPRRGEDMRAVRDERCANGVFSRGPRCSWPVAMHLALSRVLGFRAGATHRFRTSATACRESSRDRSTVVELDEAVPRRAGPSPDRQRKLPIEQAMRLVVERRRGMRGIRRSPQPDVGVSWRR